MQTVVTGRSDKGHPCLMFDFLIRLLFGARCMSLRGAVLLVLAAAALVVAGCARTADLENLGGRHYAPERDPPRSMDASFQKLETNWAGATQGCSIYDDAGASKGARGSHAPRRQSALRLSRGDVVNLLVPDGAEFNGDYTIGPDGRISLPFVRPVDAVGLSELQLAKRIERSLVRNNLLQAALARVAVRVVRYAAITVRVSGAVFQPGTQTVNEPQGQKNETEIVRPRSTIRRYGDFTIRRTLTVAIRLASGARPDADISKVTLVRRGKVRVIDLRGALTGDFVDDPALEDGDWINVPSKGCFQPELVRPSHITPRGIRIYISKMHFAADSRYDEKIPYGLRLLNAAVMASCIGGTLPTRGRREIVLVSKNPATGATEVVQRSVETLLRNKHRDNINPYLMPDDGVACYDSPVAESVDIAGAVNILLSPAKTLRAIQEPNL